MAGGAQGVTLAKDAGPSIPLSYFIRLPNVGDRVNPTIVESLTNRPVHWTHDGASPHVLAIGSVLTSATRQSHVWGTGLMHPTRGIGDLDAANIHALRGKLTYAEVRKAGLPLGDVPLGDPGALIGPVLGVTRCEQPRFALGVVPHYVDRNHPFIDALSQREGTVVLDVRDDPGAFLAQLRECQAIVSTSLHGLVFADALGIPSLWMEASGEVAGDGFKFHDWFTTSSNPQSEPFRPSSIAELADIAERCEPRTPEIDADALMAAFPGEAFDGETTKDGAARLIPVGECRQRPIPIFVISYNRADYLRRVIASYRRQSQPCEIVIHDNGSDDPETVAVLEELEAAGTKVYRHARIAHADELNDVNDSVQDFFSRWSEPTDYVVTDCDIDLSIADVDAIAVYREMLSLFRRAACVGPMLRIRDVPLEYPLFNHLMNKHIRRLWQREPSLLETSRGPVAYLDAQFDTVFAVHRAGEAFHRKKKGLRVYEPYEALHLDWYAVDENETTYQETHSEAVAHWSNRREFARFETAPLWVESFNVVERRPDGSLAIVSLPVPGAAPQTGRSEKDGHVMRRRERKQFRKRDRERRGA